MPVKEIKLKLNKLLRESNESKSFRAGAISLAEDVFFETGHYHGFDYLTYGQVPDGEEPGIRDGEIVDYTRRKYREQ